jgi:hypothetical protein
MAPEVFDPTIHDAEEWLRVFDQVAATNNWSDATKTIKLPLFLGTDLAEYVRGKCTDYEGRPIAVNWEALKRQFILFFNPDQDRLLKQSKAYQRKWDQVEPIQTYWLSKSRLFSRLPVRPRPEEEIGLFLLGLPERVRKHLTGRYGTADEAFRAVHRVIDSMNTVNLRYNPGEDDAIEDRGEDGRRPPHRLLNSQPYGRRFLNSQPYRRRFLNNQRYRRRLLSNRTQETSGAASDRMR